MRYEIENIHALFVEKRIDTNDEQMNTKNSNLTKMKPWTHMTTTYLLEIFIFFIIIV